MRLVLCSLLLMMVFSTAVQAQDTAAYSRTEIIYGRKDGMALTMIMLAPKRKANGKAVISVVSGNWVSSYENSFRFVGRAKKYVDRGYTMFLVIHGSQPRYTIPDEIADVKRAVRYIRYHAKDYKVDPNKIGITGLSSGGHLSLSVATADDKIDSTAQDPINRVSSRVQAVAVFFPPTDFINWGKQNMTPLVQFKPLLSAAGVMGAFDFKEFNDTTRTYKAITDTDRILQIAKQTSPIYAVSSDDPPTYLIHGDADWTVPVQQSQSLYKALKDANVPAELVVKKGAGHGWMNMDKEEQAFIDWFDKYLK